MELVIKIDEDYYEMIKRAVEHGHDFMPYKLIAHGVPLDKHDEELIKDTVASIWGEPCEDCISREDAISEAYEIPDTKYEHHYVVDVDDLRNMPSVTPQPKRGKWIEKTGEGFDAWAECSECGCVNPFEDDFNYCPNCGADMRGVKADDES